MSAFVLPAVLLVLLAVAFAVSSLWRSSRQLALALAVALPVLAAGLYLWRGTPQALDVAPVATTATSAEVPAAAPPDADTPDVIALIADLEAKLAADPSQWEGWALLGRVRMEQKDYAAARDALAKAHALVPDNDMVGVSYAEALMRTSADRRFPPEAVALLEHAVAATPPDQRGVFFLGMHKMISGAPGEAADLWESLLPQLEENAANALRPQIAAARAAAGQPAAAPATATAAGPTITVSVSPAAGFADRAKPGAILFVFARPKGGGPPVAAKRIVVERWPVELTLGDADQPMPTAKLSAQEEVLLVARLSLSGNAIAASGDLESTPTRVRVADGAKVALALDQVRP